MAAHCVLPVRSIGMGRGPLWPVHLLTNVRAHPANARIYPSKIRVHAPQAGFHPANVWIHPASYVWIHPTPNVWIHSTANVLVHPANAFVDPPSVGVHSIHGAGHLRPPLHIGCLTGGPNSDARQLSPQIWAPRSSTHLCALCLQ